MRWIAIALCGLVMLAGPVCALTIEENLADQREELLFREIPVVVAAARREQTISEAPSAVTVITDEDIKFFGYTTLAEALKGIVGFYTYYDREYYFAGVRGFGRPGDYNSRILLMVDGHYMNEDIYASSFYENLFGIDLDLVKRIEVIRGPGSALYGTNAMFAVINVVTKSGKDFGGIYTGLDYGANSANKELLAYGKKVNENTDLLLAGRLYNSEGNKTLYFPEFDDPAANNGIAENLDGEKSSDYFGKISFKGLTLLANSSSREKKFATGNYLTIFNDPRAMDADRRDFAEIKFEPQITKDKMGLFRLYCDSYQYDGDFPYVPGVLNRDRAEGNWWGSEAQLAWDVSDRQRLIAGAELQNHTRVFTENYNNTDPATVLFSDNRPYSIWSLYLQDEIKTPAAGLTLGLRNDNYPVFGNVLNPRLGAVILSGRDRYIKVLYGRAFRAPSFYEKYYHDGLNTMKPSENLKPEIVNSYEIVYEQGSNRDLFSTFSIYRNEIQDLINQVADPSDNLLQFQNIAQAQSTGAELSIHKTFAGGSYGRLGFAYQRTIDGATGRMLNNSPEKSASAAIVFRLPHRRTSLATELIYLDQRTTVAGNQAASYLIANLNLLTGDLFNTDISLKVNNLFDAHYADPAGESNAPVDVIPQDGRNYLIKASRKI